MTEVRRQEIVRQGSVGQGSVGQGGHFESANVLWRTRNLVLRLLASLEVTPLEVTPLLTLCFLFSVFCSGRFAEGATLLIDDFEQGTANKLGGRSNTYVQEPSRALALRVKEQVKNGAGALMLKFDKKAKGGPYDSGGWCGYYTLLKTGSRYFDATSYKAINFWVKGETGTENFVIGVADRHWDEVGDSVKSEPVGKYLPQGKLTAEWQKAMIPLDTFMIDMKELASLAVCFEGSVLPGGAGKGTVYLDDLELE